MGLPKILYCDRHGTTSEHMQRWLTNRGLAICDTTNSIDKAIEMSSQKDYAAIVFHLDMYCSEGLLERYKQEIVLLGLFKDPWGRYGQEWVPGGAVLAMYLSKREYPGCVIMTSGVGKNIDVMRLMGLGLITNHMSKMSTGKDLENLLADNKVIESPQI